MRASEEEPTDEEESTDKESSLPKITAPFQEPDPVPNTFQAIKNLKVSNTVTVYDISPDLPAKRVREQLSIITQQALHKLRTGRTQSDSSKLAKDEVRVNRLVHFIATEVFGLPSRKRLATVYEQS